MSGGSNDVLVRVEHVSRKFCKSLKRSLWYGVQDTVAEFTGRSRSRELRKNEFWAVKDVSFELKRGECLGLIGRNGAGKSTLLKMLNGLIKPDEGRIEMHGRVCSLIELSAGFNPILTGRENIYNRGALLGHSRKEMARKFDAIVDFAEIAEFLDTPVQNYSSGMKVRLGFAVSAQMEPDVLIIDEVLAVGDMGFIIKCLNRIGEIIRNSAVVFVSHSMPMVSHVSNRIMLMDHGAAEYHGTDTAKGMELYLDHFPAAALKKSGTGRARLHRLALRDRYGLATNEIRSGEPCSFDISVDSKQADYAVDVYIYNHEMRPVARLMPSVPGASMMCRCNASRSLVRVAIPSINLKMGKHSATVIVSDVDTKEVLLRVDSALSFHINSDHCSWADTFVPCSVTAEPLS